MRSTREISDALSQVHRVPAGTGVPRRFLGRVPDRYRAYLLAPPALLGFLLLWQLLVTIGSYPTFILPAPAVVFRKFLVAFGDGTLLHHTWATLREVFLGLALGLSTATSVGYVFAKSKALERLLSPYIVASQSIPIVALAPLLVIWLSYLALSGMHRPR